MLPDVTPLSSVQIARGSDRPHIVTGGTLRESRHAFDSPRPSGAEGCRFELYREYQPNSPRAAQRLHRRPAQLYATPLA